MQDYSSQTATAWFVISFIFGSIHFEPMLGAICGSFFFLAMPSTVRGFRSFGLWLVSVGFGYSASLPFARSTEDFERSLAMVVAVVISALGAAILTALLKYIEGGPLPDFLARIFDAIPWLNKKRGASDAN